MRKALGTAGAVSVILTVGLLGSAVAPALAHHKVEESQTVQLPAAGRFQACVGTGGTKVGKCDSSPLIAAGTLTLTFKGTTVHTAEFSVDQAPAECAGAPGVKITRSGGETGGSVSASLNGTGPTGPIPEQKIGPIGVSRQSDEVFAFACLEL